MPRLYTGIKGAGLEACLNRDHHSEARALKAVHIDGRSVKATGVLF